MVACPIEQLEGRVLLSHVFSPTEAANLGNGLSALSDWAGNLEQYDALNTVLPGVTTTMGKAANLKSALHDQLYVPISSYLAGVNPTDTGLGALLGTLSASAGNLTFTVSGTSGGEISGTSGNSYEFHLTMSAQRTMANTPIDLGYQWHGLNINPDAAGVVTLNAGATVGLTFGLGEGNYTPAPNAFYAKFDALNFNGDINATGLNFGADVGILGVNIVNGSVATHASEAFSVVDPDHDVAGAITLAELQGTSITTLVPPTQKSGTAHIALPVQYSFDGMPQPGGSNPKILLDSNNTNNLYQTQMSYNADFFPLLPFGGMTAADLLPAIQQITTSLSNISPLSTVNVPFVPAKSLSDLFGFTGVIDNISSGLASGGVPAFHNVQTLESKWATALGVPTSSLSATYDINAQTLTWHISAGKTNDSSTAPVSLTAGLQPLNLSSSTGTVSLTSNASFDTLLGIHLVPKIASITGGSALPGNGQFTGTTTFQLAIGNDPPETLSVQGDPSNVSIDDLVSDFNKALLSAPNDLLYKVGVGRDGLRLTFQTKWDSPAKITLYADSHDPIVTQLGFTNGQQSSPVDVFSQVFLKNTALSGNASATVSGVSAVGKLGMLGVGVSGGSGTMYMAGGFQLSGSTNPTAGGQVTAADLLQNAAANPQSFIRQLTVNGHATMSLPMTVNAGVLSLPPSASPTITVNWTHAPNPSTLSLAYNSDMNSLLDFTSVKGSDLTSSLGGIASLLGLANGGSVLSQQLPLLDKSLADMLNLSGMVSGNLSGLSLSGKTLQQVGPAIASAFSLPSGAVHVQMDGHLLRITFSVSASASGSQTLSLDLDKLVAELPNGNPAKGFLEGMSKLVAGGAGGQIAYSANATLNVSAGVDLTDPKHPAPFIDDSTNASVSLQVNGTSLSFGATMGPLGVKIQGGTAKIGATLDPGTVDSAAFSIGVEPSVTHRYALSAINSSTFTASLTGAVHAVLPLYFPLASNFVGNLDVSIGSLADIPGTLSITAPDIHSIGLNMDLSQNMDGLLEGIGQLLDQLQGSLGKQVLSTRLPLVGDKLGAAVDFIGGALRTNIYDKLKAAFDTAESTGGQASVDIARKGLYAALGPAGLNVLPAGGFGDFRDIDVTIDGVDINDPSFDPSTLINSARIEYKLHLKKSATLVSIPLKFDLGIPALGLSGDGAIQLKAGYDINLWFGVDKSDGFFIDTSPGNDGTAPEVKLDLSASIPGATMTGNLLFMQLQLKDNPADPTNFGGSFSINLNHSGDEVTLPELPSLFDPSSFDAHLSAEAKVDLLIVTSFGGNAAFPSLHANFLMDWKFSPTDPDLSGSAPTIAFKNVQLDAGEFLSSFMAPIVDKMKAVIDPIAPILDVLTAHIPGLYDVAPQYGTLVDIAQQFGLVEGADGIKALADVARVVEDFSKMTTINSGELLINLGDFDLGGADPRSPTFDPTTIDPNVTTDVGDVSNQLPSDPATQTFWEDTQDLGSAGIKMEFPLIQHPKDAFKLLLGQDVNIFTLDLPAIHLGFKAGVSIPVYSIGVATVYLNLGGSLDIQGKVAFGYDTSGIRELITDPSHNPADVFDGFYISTRQNADGTGGDMPFLSASGELKAGISVDACDLIEFGVDGGLGFTVSAFLQDPNNDGKLHVSEMIQELGEGFFSTIKITGSIYALFDAWFEIKIPLTPFHITKELFHIKATLVDVSSVHPGIQGDRFDPNTKRASAADIGVGPGIHLNNLTIAKPAEEDWFHFQLARTDDIDIATSCIPGILNTTTEVYDKNGNLLATSAGDTTALKTLTLDNLPADEYFIHVVGDGVGTGYYGLTIMPSATSTTQIYYVSPMLGSTESFYSLAPGFDGNDGLTPWTPKATVQSLLSQYNLTSTALVLIDTGKYSDSVNIGNSANGAIFAGSPRGSIYTNRDATPETVVNWNVAGGANNRITDIQFDYGGTALGSTAFMLSGGANNTVDHIQVRGYSTGIEDAATNDQLLNNQINGDIGIQIDAGASGTLVKSNSVSIDGTGIEDDGTNVTITSNFIGHLTSQSNFGTAIRIQGTSAQVLNNNVKQILNGIMVNGAGGDFLISGNQLLGFGYVPGGMPPQHPFGINIGGSGNVHVTGNSVRQFDVGISVALAAAAIDTNTVLGGSLGIDIRASNVVVGPGNPATQAGNLVYTNTATGIRIGSGLSGVRVFLNSVHDNGIGIDSSSTSNIYSNDVFKNTTGINSAGGIVGPADWTTPNTIHDNTTGIQTGANTLVRFNRIYTNQDGIIAADGDNINHNLIYRNSAHGIVDTGHANVLVTSNTIYLTGGAGLQIQNGSTNTTVRNNIFEADGGGYDVYVATDSQIGFASDYNNLYRTGAGKVVWFEKDFADLYDWQIEADLDLHSIGYIAPSPTLDAPQFVDLANDNYQLKATSTSIDSGDPASSYSMEPAPNGNNIDLGAYGNTAKATPSAASYIRIDYPNLYIDWEADRARNILWHTYNLTGNVRLELWQEGGGKVADIATVPASAGTYLWSPGNSGITPDPLTRYRIHIVTVNTPTTVAIAREFFSVPPVSNNYYVNDGSTAGDEYTTVPGDNRNTGRASNAPKADLLPVLRSYPLSANDIVHIDTGIYIDVRNLNINYNVDVTKANPGTGLGDDEGFSVVGPLWHTATLDRGNSNANTTHVDISASNFVSFSHLTLLGGSAGILVHNGSQNFNGDHLEVANTSGDGVSLDSSTVGSTLDSLNVHNNTGYGVVAQVLLSTLSNSAIYSNGRDGINLSHADGMSIQGNTVYSNGGYGIYVSLYGTQAVLVGSLNLAAQAGNIVHDNHNDGIYVSGSSPTGNIIAGNVVYGQTGSYNSGIVSTGSNDRVSLNIVYGNANGIAAYGSATVDRNRVYNNSNLGINIRGSGNLVQYNTVSGNKLGIYTSGSSTTIANNTVIDNTQAGIELDNAGAGYAASGTPPHPTILSNTIRQGAGGVGIVVQNRSAYVEIRNNIIDISAGSAAISVSSDSQVGFVSDFNLFHTAGSAIGIWQGIPRTTLAQWRNAIYGDVNSITADPQFVDAAGGDLHVQSQYGSNHGGSPAPVVNPSTHLPAAKPGYWTNDGSTSPPIDRGDAALPFAAEPAPNGNYANLGAESNTSMASLSPSSYVLVTSPTDGVVWPEAQTYNIQWRTQDNTGTVTIELVKSGSVVRTLATAAPNSGSFIWTVPADLTPDSDYTIRVTRNDGSGAVGYSPNAFVIAPVIHIYYVATTGDDSNSGLDAADPKATIRGVFFSYHVGFGDTIQVAGGHYNLTTNIFLDPTVSGITIAGSTDSANPSIIDRQNTANGSYVFQMTGASYVTLDHLALTGGYAGIYDNYTDSADHLTVSNDDFHGNVYYGINLQAANHATILNNTFSSTDQTQSLNLSITGNDNTIQGNTIQGYTFPGTNPTHSGTGISASGMRMSVLNNAVSNLNQGVQLTINVPSSPTTADQSFVSGNQIHNVDYSGLSASGYASITNNTVWNAAGGNSTWGAAISFSGVLGSLVSGNTVYGNPANGFYLTGTTTLSSNVVYANGMSGIYASGNVTVQGNTVYSNATGITYASIASGGPILNNTIYSNSIQGISILGTGGLTNGVHPTILNNTIYQPAGTGIALQNSTSNLDVRNNIIVVQAGPAYSIAADSQTGFTGDYNILYTAGGGSVALWGSTAFTTLNGWTNTLGFDTHSLNADPRFISPAGGDGQIGFVSGVNYGADDNFHLSNGHSGGEFPTSPSPAIDAGDPASFYLAEPQPNGNRVNIGADGNTPLANPSVSPAIQVTSPAAGDQLQEGQTYPITWQSTGLAAQNPVAFINSGGPVVGKWSADYYNQLASNGQISTWTYSNTIDTTGVTNPAPQSVYQSAVYAYGNSGANTTLGYDLSVPDGTYTLRLHFVEPSTYVYGYNDRHFDIIANGVTLLPNYSIIGHTGVAFKADIQQFTVSASGGTGIQLRLSGLYPIISGVEVLAANPAGLPNPRFNVDVSVDNGVHWQSVATNLSTDQFGNGRYNWTAGPASDGNIAILRVTSADNGAVVGQTLPFQIAPSGHSFYINDNSTAGDEYTTAVGNDANNGKMPSRPMASLSALLAAYSPHAGDTIYVDSGTYNLVAPIILTGVYSGVRIVGPTSHQAVINRNNTVSGAYAFEISGASNITLDHLTITGAYEGIHADYAGTPNTGLTITNNTIYANYYYGINLLTGNNNAVITGNTVYGIPGSYPATTTQNYGIYISGNNASISGNIVYQNNSYGLYINGTGNTLSGNTVYNNGAYGIYAYTANTITGNTVFGQTISNYGNGGRGISVSSGATAIGNTVYGNLIGVEASGTGTVVSGNRVYNNATEGLSVGPTVLTQNNTIYSNGIGVLVTGGYPDQVGRVSGNLIYANSTAGIQVSGGSMDSSTGAHVIIASNTIYQPSADGIQITSNSKYVELRNNIIDAGAGYAVKVDTDSVVGLVSDYNLLNAFGSAQIGRFSNVSYATLNDWYYNTLQDDHSVSGDPLFVNPAGVDTILGYSGGADHGADDNFQLQSGSPAIDTGDPSYLYVTEPQPNGDRVNIGYDGNTPQANTGSSPHITLTNPSGHQRLTVGVSTTISWDSVGITPQSPVALINCGGPAVGGFSANAYLTVGTTYTNSSTVDTSGIIDPAPASVYASYAQATYGLGGKLQYSIPVPDGAYTLRLHFSEPYYSSGNRPFDIRINGVTARSSYDIAADAGTLNKAVQQTFTTTATGGQGITLELVNDSPYYPAIISGFEVLRDNVGAAPAPTFNLQVSTDGGGSWSTIASGLTANHLGKGSYNWTPQTASSNALLRITSSTDVRTNSSPLIIAPAGHDYYINDNSTSGDTLPTAIGNNTNTGKLPDQPMASLQALLALYHPAAGDTVHVANGTYMLPINITPTSANNGLLIQGPTSGTALFSRIYISSSQRQLAAFQLAGVSNLTLDHLSITGGDYGILGPDSTNYTTVSNHLTVSNSTIYSNISAGIYLGTYNNFAAITTSTLYSNPTNLSIAGTDAIVSGNTTHHASSYGIYLTGVRFLIQNNNVYASSYGIYDSTSITPLTYVNTISGNTVHDNTGTGINASGDTTVIGNAVYGQITGSSVAMSGSAQFIGNTVYNNNAGISVSAYSGIVGMASGNRVFHNITYGIMASGVAVVSGNRVYSNNVGIQTDSNNFSGRIENNLVYSNATQGIQINRGGYSSNSYGTIYYNWAQINNNTVYQPVGDAIHIQNSSAYVSLRNNLLQSNTGYDIYVSSDSQTAGINSDWNLLVRQNTPASRTAYWGGADRLTLADWQAAAPGRDTDSATTTDAKFINVVGADNVFAYDTTQNIDGGADDNFQLAAGSPAIDRGTEWAGPSTDLLNHVRVDDPGTVNAGSHQYVYSQLGTSNFTSNGVSQSWSGNSTYWTLNLPFSFNFYDQNYTQVYVSSAGYLQFGTSSDASDNSNSAAYLEQGYARIAPMWNYMNTDAVYVDSSVANQITIRWTGTERSSYPYQTVNFSATLFSNGSIQFNYGSGNSLGYYGSATVGISAGDGIHYKLGSYNGSSSLGNSRSLFFDHSVAGFTDLGAYEFTGQSNDSTVTVVNGITPSLIATGGTARLPISAITLSFNHALSYVDAVSAGLYELRSAGADGVFGTSDDTLYTLIPQYTADSTNLTLNIFGSALPQGNYRLTVFGTAPRALHDVNGQIIDGDANGSAGGNYVRSFVMGPLDIAPVVTLTAPLPINEGVPFSQDASFVDPDAGDSWTATVNYGDNSGTSVLPLNPDQTFHLAHNYADNGAYTITVSVTDSFGLSGTKSISQVINEVAPAATFASNGPVLEGSTATVSFTNPTDPSPVDSGYFRYSYDFNNDGVFEIINTTSTSALVPAQYLPIGSGTITIHGRITTINDNTFTDYTTPLTINNIPPGITVNLNASLITTQTYTITGSFTDPGTAETYTATVDYGDGAGPQSLVLQPGRTFTLSHAYTLAGNYPVTVSISDGGVSPAIATGTAAVSNPAVIPATGINISCTQDLHFAGPIASFTPFAGTTLADYQVAVDFGDGVNDGSATIYDGGDGKFYVQGSKIYSSISGSPYTITTTITDPAIGLATVTSTATVAEPVFVTLATAGIDINPTRGYWFSGPVATFTPLAGSIAGDYLASVDWGDAAIQTSTQTYGPLGIPGGGGNAWVVDNNDGTFSVYGSHTYYNPGTFNIGTTISDGPYVSGSASSAATVTNPLPYISAYNLYATQFQPFADQWVAYFTDQYPAADISAYSATIDWGDGHSSSANVNFGGSYYYITASYNYQTFGAIPFTVTLDKTVVGDPLQTVTSSRQAQVNAAIWNGNGVDIAVPAQTSAPVTVAQFTPDPAADISQFAATITWGDGQTTTGTILPDAANPGQFLVTGTADYSLAGDYSLTVRVIEQGYGGATSETDYAPAAHVTAVPLQVTVLPIHAMVGNLFQGQVATFIDPNLGSPAPSDFTATILWGDGQQSSGLISPISGNTFSVSGSHLYSAPGSLPLQVLIGTTPISDPIVNGGFESTTPWGWQSSGDYPPQAYPWGYSGNNSVFLGDNTNDWNDWGWWDYGYYGGSSIVAQTITVPSGSSTLQFWVDRTTAGAAGDSQKAMILDSTGNLLSTIWSGLVQDPGWVETSFDLTPYAGQTIQVAFEVDLAPYFSWGYAYPYTSMYLDDVSVTRPDKSGDGNAIATVSETLPAWLDPTSTATWDSGTHTLTVTGPAKIIADPGSDNPSIVDGNAGSIEINGGITVTNVGPITGTGSLIVDAGASLTAKSIAQTSLTVNGSLAIPDKAHSGGQIELGSVDVAGNTTTAGVLTLGRDGSNNFTGKIDLADCMMLVHYIQNSVTPALSDGPADYIDAALAQGRSVVPGGVFDGPWNASGGIVSSTAAQNFIAAHNATGSPNTEFYAVGYGDTGKMTLPNGTITDKMLIDDAGPSFFDPSANSGRGAGIGSTVFVRYTRVGDTTMDGIVGNNDVTVLGLNFDPSYNPAGTSPRHWYDGNFNYNGVVDNNDVTILGLQFDPSNTTAVPAVTPSLSVGTSAVTSTVKPAAPASKAASKTVASTFSVAPIASKIAPDESASNLENVLDGIPSGLFYAPSVKVVA